MNELKVSYLTSWKIAIQVSSINQRHARVGVRGGVRRVFTRHLWLLFCSVQESGIFFSFFLLSYKQWPNLIVGRISFKSGTKNIVAHAWCNLNQDDCTVMSWIVSASCFYVWLCWWRLNCRNAYMFYLFRVVLVSINIHMTRLCSSLILPFCEYSYSVVTVCDRQLFHGFI